MGGYIPSSHYRAVNIVAVREWAIARITADGDDVDPLVVDIEDWCRAWLENGPLDGGDPSERRAMRPDWRSIYCDYLRLGGH